MRTCYSGFRQKEAGKEEEGGGGGQEGGGERGEGARERGRGGGGGGGGRSWEVLSLLETIVVSLFASLETTFALSPPYGLKRRHIHLPA